MLVQGERRGKAENRIALNRKIFPPIKGSGARTFYAHAQRD